MIIYEKIAWAIIAFLFAAIIGLMIAAKLVHAQPALVAPDGTYLGQLSTNPYLPDSTSNPYGVHGSRYSDTSINNQYSTYGSPYSSQSPNNPYAPGNRGYLSYPILPDMVGHGAVQGEW